MNQAPIQGSWTHSHEEDQGDVEVYRPTHSFAFPPARGRETLEFGAGGALIQGMPGPDDRPQETAASWTALGMNRFRVGGRDIEIVEQTPEVLKIRKV